MKKGLLSILAGALVVVGCQNYDDQFDNLESQISALASTVAGLTQVQSDLSALAGTVASLSSTVNSLGDTIDTAVADGLTDIQADIDAIESAVADVASSEEVSALSDAVADSQEDLDQLLQNGSIFQGSVIINSVSTLEVYHAMGSGINIVNGSVDIDVDTDMDIAKVQEVVNNILVTVEDFNYTSEDSDIAEVTFNNLTGTTTLTVEQAGGYNFQALESADVINLGDEFESTVTVIHFGALKSIQEFQTEGVADLISFNKATELHLTSLSYIESGELTIVTDEGAALPLDALDDEDSSGDEQSLDLDITGPASVTISSIAKGSFTFTDVATVALTDFRGSVTLGEGVESFTSNHVESLNIDDAEDLETLDITAAKATDADGDVDEDTLHGPAISVSSLSSIETVDIDGDTAAVTIDGNGNLVSVILGGTHVSASITDNSDLTTITVTGASIGNVTITDNGDLAELTLDHTSKVDDDDDTSFPEAVTVNISDNENLTDLTFSADDVSSLTIQGNSDLAMIDFTGLEDANDAEEVTVKIGSITVAADGNALTASSITDSYDEDADDPDTGSITTESGMETLVTYLDAVIADASLSGIQVYFDEVDSYNVEDADGDEDETTNIDIDSDTAAEELTVVDVTGDIVDDTPRVYQKRTLQIEVDTNALYADNDLDTDDNDDELLIDLAGVAVSFGYAEDNDITTVTEMIDAINAADDWGNAWNVTAARGGYEAAYVEFDFTDADGAAAAGGGAGDAGYTFGSVTGTFSVASADFGTTSLVYSLYKAISTTKIGALNYSVAYGASSDILKITRLVTGTTNIDLAPGAAMPALSISEIKLNDNSTTTLAWSSATYGGSVSNLASQDSDYYLAITTNNVDGFYVTIENTSTTVAVDWANDTTTLQTGDTLTDDAVLVSGTNFTGSGSNYKASFADIVVPADTVEGNDTDRTAWL